jgi:hypothetical protein
MDTASRFADFGRGAESGGSPVYAEWAAGAARDPALVALIDRARPSQRQPVLAFAVARLLGAPVGPYDGLRQWLLGHADAFVAELDERHTQTNDVRRTGPIAWALAAMRDDLDGRAVALLEVGASAGLGLYPDRYEVRVGGRPLGPRPVVAFRGGLDLAPLDVTRDADRLWLEILLWPGQDDRVALLGAAVEVARREPPTLMVGDAVDGLDDLIALAPPGSVPVVITAGTLVYLTGARRQAFVDEIARLGIRWISYERTGLLTGIHATLPERLRDQDPGRPDALFATLAVDGRAIALGDAHGTRLRPLASRPARGPRSS